MKRVVSHRVRKWKQVAICVAFVCTLGTHKGTQGGTFPNRPTISEIEETVARGQFMARAIGERYYVVGSYYSHPFPVSYTPIEFIGSQQKYLQHLKFAVSNICFSFVELGFSADGTLDDWLTTQEYEWNASIHFPNYVSATSVVAQANVPANYFTESISWRAEEDHVMGWSQGLLI